MSRMRWALALGFLLLGLAGCSSPSASVREPATAVTGSIKTDGRAYPVGSRLTLEIRDLSDATGTVLAETSGGIAPGWEIAGMHRSIDFRLPFDPARVTSTDTYILTGRIMEGEDTVALLGPAPVITNGAPTTGLTLITRNRETPGRSAETTGEAWLDVDPSTIGTGPAASTGPTTTPSAP